MTPSAALGAPAHTGRGLLLLALAGVVWGTIGPGVHLVLERSELSVLSLGAYRSVAAVTTLLVAVLVSGRLRAAVALGARHRARVVVVGVLTAGFQLLFFVAVVAAGVSIATMVALGFAPVLLLVVGSVKEQRLPGAPQVLAVLTAVTGLAVLCLVGVGEQTAANLPLGVVAALGSGAAYAMSTDVASPLTRSHDALAVTTATMAVTAALLVPAGVTAAYAGGEGLPDVDPTTWALVLYLGVVTMALAYVLLYAGLRSTPSGTAVVVTLLEPVAAVAVAVVWLGETLTAAGVAGSLLIVAAIASLGRQAEPPPQ